MSKAPDPVATPVRGHAGTTADRGQAPAPATPGRQAWIGPLMTLLSLLAFGVTLYLTWVKLAGVAPVCAIVSGCETVEKSRYSEFLGVPVAAFGMVGTLLMLGGSLLWWRRHDRRGLVATYLVGLASLPVLAWLTYLELFVIHAVCIWCVAYAVLVIATWVIAMLGLRAPTPDERA